MVQAFERERSISKLRSFRIRKMFEIAGNRGNSFHENGDETTSSIEKSRPSLTKDGNVASSHLRGQSNSDTDQMKEKFSKLLLGEDMSGGWKWSFLSSGFIKCHYEPCCFCFWVTKEARADASRYKEIDWLLSVTDHIVEFAPSQKRSPDGTTMEVMTTRQRNDLHMNIPALRKLDVMLIECLDNFEGPNEFWYVSKNEKDSANETTRHEDKWWLPCPLTMYKDEQFETLFLNNTKCA